MPKAAYLRLKGPERATEPPKARLHLVRDTHGAVRAHLGVCGGEVAGRQCELACARGRTLAEERCDFAAGRGSLGDDGARSGGAIEI